MKLPFSLILSCVLGLIVCLLFRWCFFFFFFEDRLAYLEKHLPNSRTILVENAGHFSFLLNWAEILTSHLA